MKSLPALKLKIQENTQSNGFNLLYSGSKTFRGEYSNRCMREFHYSTTKGNDGCNHSISEYVTRTGPHKSN